MVLRNYMVRVIKQDAHDLDHNVERYRGDGQVDCVSREDWVQALKEMKTGIAPGLSDVSLELSALSGTV